MAVWGEDGFQRSIHNIENSPFRTKFERDVNEMSGNCGIGCISDNEAQPLLVSSHLGSFAITTVGRINNINELKEECFETGKVQFLEMSHGLLNPTELVAALINCKDNVIEGIRYAQEKINGSMSILLLFPNRIYAARDRVGRTPVVIGKSKDSHCVSFESCAFLNLGYKSCYELGPGEIVAIEYDGYTSLSAPNDKMQICSFLWTYYGYPTATYEGINVEAMRYRCGELLYNRDDVEADSVAGVPDSGLAHAIGYANASGIPYSRPLIKYTPTWPRSFMPANQKQRNLVARMKLIPVHDLIKGKKLVLIDDSIVRGTQLSETVDFLYSAGVQEVHVRPACPPIMFGCKFLNFSRNVSNMDLISRRVIAEIENVDEVTDELIREYVNPNSEKYQQMVDAICKKMNFTTLKFHRIDDLVKAIGLEKCKLCTYCFDGKEE
jgi:amidophosphoribosyltransferase